MCLFDIRRDQGGDERYASGIGAGGLAYAEWNWQYVMSVDTRKLQGNTSSLWRRRAAVHRAADQTQIITL